MVLRFRSVFLHLRGKQLFLLSVGLGSDLQNRTGHKAQESGNRNYDDQENGHARPLFLSDQDA